MAGEQCRDCFLWLKEFRRPSLQVHNRCGVNTEADWSREAALGVAHSHQQRLILSSRVTSAADQLDASAHRSALVCDAGDPVAPRSVGVDIGGSCQPAQPPPKKDY